MKIGTLTFHRAQNYGGVLQCYALVKFLQHYGYDAQVADYRCPKIEAAYKVIDGSSLKTILLSILHLKERLKAKHIFAEFRKKNLPISKEIYTGPSDFSNQFDVCIMGSDQVWTLRLVGGFNPIYYGEFSPSIRKVGYAVSIAEISHFTEEERRQMAEHLKNFSHFSTREESLCDELKRFSSKKLTSVLDPSLLLTQDEYASITEEPVEKDYVLYYQQEYNSETKHLIIDVAKQVGAKLIVVITGKKEVYDYPYRFYNTSTLSVPKFLGLFKNAKMVFTSSFHGTAYSLVFRKDFYFVANNAPDRALNLLIKCGAEDRLIHSTDKVIFSKVNYTKVEPMLNAARQHSIDFLINAVDNK